MLMLADFAVAVVSVNARAAADDSPSPLVVVIIIRVLFDSSNSLIVPERDGLETFVFYFGYSRYFGKRRRRAAPLSGRTNNILIILRADYFDGHTTRAHGRIKKSIRANGVTRICVVEHCAHDFVFSGQYDTYTIQQNPKV